MGDTWERVQLASARVPFRLKVAVVWVVLFAVLAFLGNAAGFDVEWIRDNFRYILGGLRYTMVIAVSGIVLAIVLALLGALARHLAQPGGVRRRRLLRVVLPRHPADRADVPALPRAASGRSQPRGGVLLAAGGLRPGAGPGRRDGRHARARPQLRRLHDRDLPGRHPVGGGRAGRGGRRAGHDVRAEDAQGGAAAGVPGDHPADRQRVHRDDEGHRARLVPGCHHRQRRGLPPVPAGRQGRLQEPRGVRRRRARLLGPDRAVHVLPVPAGAPDRARVRPGARRTGHAAAAEQGQPHAEVAT